MSLQSAYSFVLICSYVCMESAKEARAHTVGKGATRILSLVTQRCEVSCM